MPEQIEIINPLYVVDYDDPLGIDADQATGDKAVFVVPPEGCTVIYAACLVTEVCAGSTSTPIVKYDKRPTAGSDTSRGDGDIATLALATTAGGKWMYDYAAKGTELVGGQEVVVELATAAVGTPTGHFRPVLAIKRNTEMIDNITNGVETA